MKSVTHDAIYLAGPVRTAMGSFNGMFADTPATELGSAVIRAALERSRVPPEAVDQVIFGNVLSAGLGQNPARQAGRGAGLSDAVGAFTVNKVCGSGLMAVALASQAIRCGDASVVAAGGMENMSCAPHLLGNARRGLRLGSAELTDSLVSDGLSDAYEKVSMGCLGERCAARFGFTREQQDDFAVESYRRALDAAGLFANEIVGVEVKRGAALEDEEPRRFDEAKLRRLRPAFQEGGTVTAGNASSLNDGAAGLIALSGEAVRRLNVEPPVRILDYVTASGEPAWFTVAPVEALRRLLGRLEMTVANIDLFEINEAFAVVTMAAMQELQIPHEKVNVHGGAVALGHPIGASGARILVTLIHAMQQRNARIGIAVLCIGGGEAVAMAVERVGD